MTTNEKAKVLEEENPNVDSNVVLELQPMNNESLENAPYSDKTLRWMVSFSSIGGLIVLSFLAAFLSE